MIRQSFLTEIRNDHKIMQRGFKLCYIRNLKVREVTLCPSEPGQVALSHPGGVGSVKKANKTLAP